MSKQYEVHSRQQGTGTQNYSLLLTAYCLLPSAYCLLLTVYCLLNLWRFRTDASPENPSALCNPE